MKPSWKKLSAALLSALLVGLTACGDSPDATPGPDGGAAAQAEPGDAAVEDSVTLTVWNTEVLTPGVQTTPVAQELARKTGVTMDIIQGDSQKFSLLLAGGDLPDIIYTNPAQQGVTIETLLDGNHILALDELIETHGGNIKANFASHLNYSRQFLSGGRDQVYFLPVLSYEGDPENPDISYSIANVGLMVRWDIYAAIGYPEIETTDDFLDALAQMQAYARDNDLADGKQIYAISGWNDWGLWPWYLANMREMGYKDSTIDGTSYNVLTGEVKHNFENDAFWDSIEFYHKAYNMGIVDPEAFVMTNDQWWEQAMDGQILMAHASWQTDGVNLSMVANNHADWGFEKLPNVGYDLVWGIVGSDEPLGNGSDYATAITTNCKNPELAMQFIDFCQGEEGSRLIHSGIEGEHWEYVDGEARFTDEYMENMRTVDQYTEKTGVTRYNKLAGFKQTQMMADGFPADLQYSNTQKAAKVLDIDIAYCDYYSALLGETFQFPGQVLNHLWQQGEIKTYTGYDLFADLTQSLSSDNQSTLDMCTQYMNSQVVKCITASTMEEFTQNKADAMAELESRGYYGAVEEIYRVFDQAKADAESFTY